MATKKTTKATIDLSSKTADELKADLIVAQTELVELKRTHAVRELKNTESIKHLRAQIARINTALSQSAKSEEKK